MAIQQHKKNICRDCEYLRTHLKALIVIAAILIVCAGGLILFHKNIRATDCDDLEFVSQDCKDPVIDKKAYLGLRASLEEYFAAETAEGRLDSASVYFRDLEDGPVMGIKEHDIFSSASLLKLPVVMAVYKLAEERPEILDYELIYGGADDPDVNQYIVPDERIESEVPYPVKEVIRRALVFSDNRAVSMLHDFINIEGDVEGNIRTVFRDLGLVLPDDLGDRDVSTRSYASLFRLLYTSSYLSPKYSDEILEHLSKSHFNALRSGVPEGVAVASKFGERYFDETKQLHDCGVVYYPGNPYLLCVMTQGKDYAYLARIITEVSKRTYAEVESRSLISE